ncbi:uncharacterized protein EKO05_0001979 [Ascochyta rabiei]|uniref:Uncharacterized protein n=1 Tax=Didymella rabiei TaxID=5454 RepID=A0A163FPN6_DIDRA|nr:uncharacterized protein EKO05_0001979 [Ascochyta rabiei]KZM24476.1 hypothetical protein ST47_g4376 [Ascochyta rabiei]UPX11373.1 hypothetical protein EKO05_0001979 [Ascochyta rabiei]
MPYTIFMFVTRKPGMTLEAFVDHYEKKHIPLVLEVLGDQAPVRHTRHYVKRNPAAAEGNDVPPPLVFFGDAATIDYDCITTVELRDEAHFQAFNEQFANSPRKKELEDDQAAFADGTRFRVVAVESPRVTEP